MKYRSRAEIVAKILEAANKGATKTRIMYGAYTSYAQVKEYLSFLLNKGLLIYEDGTGVYRVTEKGQEYLRAFSKVNEIVSLDDVKETT